MQAVPGPAPSTLRLLSLEIHARGALQVRAAVVKSLSRDPAVALNCSAEGLSTSGQTFPSTHRGVSVPASGDTPEQANKTAARRTTTSVCGGAKVWRAGPGMDDGVNKVGGGSATTSRQCTRSTPLPQKCLLHT